MDGNIYTSNEGEVIFLCCRLCDDFEKYISDIARPSWTPERMNRLFNIFIQRKFKELRGWHGNIVKYVSAWANVDHYPQSSTGIKHRLCLGIKIEFIEQADECLLHPIYTYES